MKSNHFSRVRLLAWVFWMNPLISMVQKSSNKIIALLHKADKFQGEVMIFSVGLAYLALGPIAPLIYKIVIQDNNMKRVVLYSKIIHCCVNFILCV